MKLAITYWLNDLRLYVLSLEQYHTMFELEEYRQD